MSKEQWYKLAIYGAGLTAGFLLKGTLARRGDVFDMLPSLMLAALGLMYVFKKADK